MPATPPSGFPRITPHLIYDDVDGAITFLTEVFGFRERESAHHVLDDGRTGRAQIEVDDALITLGLPSIHGDSPSAGVSSMLYVFVEDVVAHRDRSRAAGAHIVTDITTHAGHRRYQVADPEGHQWTFAESVDA